MFFFKVSNNSCHAVSGVINRFCNVSGQIVNLHKSFVNFSPNICTEKQQEFKHMLCMPSTSNLGVYLGVPVDIQSSKVQHFTPVLDKVMKAISSWNHLTLSQPAKLLIINTILLGKIMHYLSVFKIPATVCNKLDSLMAMFFWKDGYGKGIHWKKRSVLHHPKKLGGLGLRSAKYYHSQRHSLNEKGVAYKTTSSDPAV